MRTVVFAVLLSILCTTAFAQTTVAVFDFSYGEKEIQVEEMGRVPNTIVDIGLRVGAAIRQELGKNSQLQLVERERLDDLISEMGLSMTGIVDQEKAIKIGNMAGAKILVMGNYFELDNNLFINAKIIGTETSVLFAYTVKGSLKQDIQPLIEELVTQVSKIVYEKKNIIVAKEVREKSFEEKIVDVRAKLGVGKLPIINISINEKNLKRGVAFQVAATETAYLLQKLGFEVYEDLNKAEVKLEGSAFSEFGTRKGDLVSCKAGIDLKVLDLSTNRLLAVDREFATVVDIAEDVAASKALQKATQDLLLRLTPEFTNKWRRQAK